MQLVCHDQMANLQGKLLPVVTRCPILRHRGMGAELCSRVQRGTGKYREFRGEDTYFALRTRARRPSSMTYLSGLTGVPLTITS